MLISQIAFTLVYAVAVVEFGLIVKTAKTGPDPLPFLGKDDVSRQQTWIILAGASLCAAFPHWYATLFSGFSLVLLMILLALIARGVSSSAATSAPGCAGRGPSTA